MNDLISLIQENASWVLIAFAGISIFIEFTPIKVNPLSWIYKTFKNKITEDIHQENEDINRRLDEVVYVKSRHYDEIVHNLDDMNNKIFNVMETMNSKLDEMYENQDENEMVRLRWEILSFADSLRSSNKHSKDAFHHIIESNDKYHRIINKRGFTNGVIDAEMAFIMETYRTLRDNDDFA